MTFRPRIADKFKRQSAEPLVTLAGAVITGLTGDPAFPAPTVGLKALEAAADSWAGRSESVDGYRVGQTIRFAIVGLNMAFPRLAKQKGSLDHWAQGAIEQCVNAQVPSAGAFGNLINTEGPSDLRVQL